MLRVSEIEMHDFMSHVYARVTLPERGVVLVTGPNGAGKSAFIEAVSMAWWGKSIRRATPWAKDVGAVRVGTYDAGTVVRSRFGGRTTVKLEGHEAHDTASKAQVDLNAQLPPWGLWRRACVWSSTDAASFGAATDGERKRLLEAVLGLDKFDKALEECRANVKAAEELERELSIRREVADSEYTSAKDHCFWAADGLSVEEYTRSDYAIRSRGVPTGAGLLVLKSRCAALELEIEKLGEDSRTVGRRLHLANKQYAEAVSESRVAERRAHALSKELCPTCEQTIPSGLRDRLNNDIEDRSTIASQVEVLVSQFEVETTRLRDRLAEANREVRDLRAQIQLADSLEKELASIEQSRLLEAERMELAQIKLDDITLDHDGAVADLETWRAVETVVGLRGVRASVLGRALSALEQIANGWLDRIAGPGLRLKLSSVREKGDGTFSDEVTMEVEGAGGGHGYAAASGGQRRRIDVAVLLALSELTDAAAPDSMAGGTLFCDEVFDALDSDGVAAVAGVLSDVARGRCVVVVTHNDELVRSLSDVRMHVRVSAGGVTTT